MRHPSYSTRCTPTRHAEFGHRKTHASWTTTTAINEIQIQKDDRSIASQLFGWFLGFLRDTNQLCESLSTLNRSMERPLRIRSLTWSASPSAGRPCDRSYKAHCWRVSIAALAPYRVQDPILTRGKHFKIGEMEIEWIITVIFFFFGALPNVVRSALVSDICETERQLKCGVLLEISHQADGRRQKTDDRQIQHERVRERERGRVFCINGYFSVHTHTYTYTYSEWEGESARETHTKEDKSTRYRTRSIRSTHVRGSLATTAAATTTRTCWEASTMRYEKLTDR